VNEEVELIPMEDGKFYMRLEDVNKSIEVATFKLQQENQSLKEEKNKLEQAYMELYEENQKLFNHLTIENSLKGDK
jgi:cell division protein FtsB